MAAKKKSAAQKAPLRMSMIEKMLWGEAGNRALYLPTQNEQDHGVEIQPVRPTWNDVLMAVGHGSRVMLEPVRLPSGNVLVVDEEGLLKRHNYNTLASSVAQMAGVAQIMGPAVFVPKHLVRKVLG